MEIQINVDVTNKKDIESAINTLMLLKGEEIKSAKAAEPEAEALPNGHIKEKKKAKKEEAETFDLDAAVEEETKKITLTEVIKAFQNYATKHSRQEAAKILAKFKAKSVKDMKEEHYEKALKLLQD